jgi:hypothetical protein
VFGDGTGQPSREAGVEHQECQRTQPCGAVRIVPAAARTVFGVVPGVEVVAVMLAFTCDFRNARRARWRSAA